MGISVLREGSKQMILLKDKPLLYLAQAPDKFFLGTVTTGAQQVNGKELTTQLLML
jgi:hypothetical protein